MSKLSNNEFKTISLTQKQGRNWACYFCIVLSIITVMGGVWLSDLVHTLRVPMLEYLAVPPMIFAIFMIWKWYKSKKQKIDKRISRNLRFFLHSNGLFTKESVEVNADGKKEQRIINSAVLGYLISDSHVTIRFYKRGDSFSDKASTFDTSMCALIGLPLENKQETISYCDYIFSRHSDRRIIITGSSLRYNHTTHLPLNSNLSWNILKQPHLLLAGVTGSGKTTFLNYLVIEMKKMQADIYICDPKRSDLASLKNIIGADYVASDTNNIAKLSRIVKEQMEQRFITYKENANNFVYGYSFVDYKLKPVFIIFDELGAFRASADKKVFSETMDNLTAVILKGREMGVFCVLSTQQPNANNIPTELRDNLSVRLAMGSMSSEAYRMVFGEDIQDLQSVSAVGSGYIYLDGLGWSKPKPYEAPYLDYTNFNFIEELKKYQKDTLAEDL